MSRRNWVMKAFTDFSEKPNLVCIEMTPQEQAVKAFFDTIADTYRDRYTRSDRILRHLFEERLQAVTEGIVFDGAKVLDIGAGAGSLYDYFQKNCQNVNYQACDISGRMLEQSDIPQAQRHVGTVMDGIYSGQSFDYIFLLGLSTYLEPTSLQAHLEFIRTHLSKEGLAIISFTNRRSLDLKLRVRLRFIFQWFRAERSVLSQRFHIMAYRQEEAVCLAKAHHLYPSRIKWINRMAFPLTRLAPDLSIYLAAYFKRKNIHPTLLASDFILFLRPEQL